MSNTARSHRSRWADPLVGITAHANGLVLDTRRPAIFFGLDDLVAVVGVCVVTPGWAHD